MKGEKMYDCITDIDSDIISEAKNYKPKKVSFVFVWKKWTVAAACVVLVLGAVSGFAVYAEAKEYQAAVSFFHEYNLSVDGLARDEIKAVYRDITTEKFAYQKTAEVLTNSVGGYEIFQENPTPEDLQNLWNNRNSDRYLWSNKSNGTDYHYDYVYKFNERLGYDVYENTVITKTVSGADHWTTTLNNMLIESYTRCGDSVIFFGQTLSNSSSDITRGRITMVDENGVILWDKTSSNDFQHEYISAVLFCGDKIASFSRGDFRFLCYTEYDLNGNVTVFTQNEIGSSANSIGIWGAARLGSEYIVQLHDTMAGTDTLVKIKADGTLDVSFTYTSEDSDYYITDMIEFNGSIYLSANMVPRLAEDESSAGGRYEAARVLNEIFQRQDWDIPDSELTQLLRDNYTAVLLVCDTESGVPQTFFSVSGSFGAGLSLNEGGNLMWNVESITDSFFSPYTSSFSIGGESYEYRYTFDSNGKLLSQDKTGEIVQFRK